MKVIGVIPARYASTRFPGKVLAAICGRPMVEWVWRGASEAKRLNELLIATEEEIVALAARRFGARVEITRADHECGTDRLGEIAERFKADYYVNIQGDEPLVRGDAIDALVDTVVSERADMGTLAYRIGKTDGDVKILEQPQCVKVVTNRNDYALYFSRAPVPWAREGFARGISRIPHGLPVYRHLGIYAYRCAFLRRFTRLKPAALERFEALEQLRALAHGFRISVAVTRQAPHAGIDTPHDLKRVRRLLGRS